MHALVPMTGQEERVEGVLLQYGITRMAHTAFPVNGRAYVTDFFLPNQGVVIECGRAPAAEASH